MIELKPLSLDPLSRVTTSICDMARVCLEKRGMPTRHD